MIALLPPLLALGAFGLYFLTSFRLARWRRTPWEFLAVIAAGAGLGVWLFVRTPGPGTAASALTSVAILGFACWFLFSFSMYGPREDRPRVGDRFPDFALPASDGTTFSLAAARGRRLLVLCYRGDW
jgi:hypothetical protein